MQRQHAQRLCDEVNSLNSVYVADVEKSGSIHGAIGGFGVVVKHSPSGNEVGFADTQDEARYMVDGIKRRCVKTVQD